MIFKIYKKALDALMKLPFKAWGLTLLCGLLGGMSASLFLIPIVAICVGILFSVASMVICLYALRGQDVETLMVFDNFKSWPRAKRILCGMGWMLLWIFLWSLIPVAGPIIAIIRCYEYRFVPYILACEPEIAPKDALEESKKRTNGLKAKMFWADVLLPVVFFAAWGILYGISSLLCKIYIGYLLIPVCILVLIAYYLLIGFYKGLVKAAWYDTVTNGTEEEPVKAAAKVCPICGKKFAPDTKFCDIDGVSLIDEQ